MNTEDIQSIELRKNMLEKLKAKVCSSNLKLVDLGLVIFTWGNVSALDKTSQLVVIKPSGVSYDKMKAEHMVVVDLQGNVIEGEYNPSSDTPTHLELYKQFKTGSVVHTHSMWATIWAQAGKNIPALGTTHADNFHGDIPVTRSMLEDEINGDYESETGKLIVETFRELNHRQIPAIVVKNHGPFTWADSVEKAVENAAVLEYVSKMAYYTLGMNSDANIEKVLLDKHYLRKHGEASYYGQE